MLSWERVRDWEQQNAGTYKQSPVLRVAVRIYPSSRISLVRGYLSPTMSKRFMSMGSALGLRSWYTPEYKFCLNTPEISLNSSCPAITQTQFSLLSCSGFLSNCGHMVNSVFCNLMRVVSGLGSPQSVRRMLVRSKSLQMQFCFGYLRPTVLLWSASGLYFRFSGFSLIRSMAFQNVVNRQYGQLLNRLKSGCSDQPLGPQPNPLIVLISTLAEGIFF